jgi:hypothetical protein
MFPNWMYVPGQGGVSLQGGSGTSLQGGSSASLGASSGSGLSVQPAGSGTILQNGLNPQNFVDPAENGSVLGANTTVDPAAQAAAAAAAANAAKAASLRSQITGLANTVKDIFNSRYGQVDQSAGEQEGKLNERFGTESGDITKQVEQQNQQIGAAHASAGTYDSSYRGNNVDTSTQGGANQIRDLGTELQDNIAKIASWVTSQKAGFDANKGGVDAILSHLAEETNPDNLSTIRGSLDQQIANLKAGAADNNTTAQNVSALEGIAPTTARAQTLQVTLKSILGGNADPTQKATIGNALISNAGLSDPEKQQLQAAFSSDLQSTQKQQVDPTQQTPTA